LKVLFEVHFDFELQSSKAPTFFIEGVSCVRHMSVSDAITLNYIIMGVYICVGVRDVSGFHIYTRDTLGHLHFDTDHN